MTEEEKLKFAIAAAKAKKKQDVDGIRARAGARKTATERKANTEAGQSKGGLDAQDKFFEQFVPEMTDEELLERQLLARQKLARQNVAQAPKDWKTTLWENIIGDNDPTTQNTGEKIGSFLNKAGESMTLGLVGDEASAAVESLAPGVDYEDRRDHYRQQEEVLERDHPGAAMTAEIGGALLPALATGGLAAGATMPSTIARGAALGLGEGATYGFMEGQDGLEGRLNEAGTYGLVGAGAGAFAPPIIRGAQSAARGVVDPIAAALNMGNRGRANKAMGATMREAGQSPDDLARSVGRAAQQGQPEFRTMDALGMPGQRRASGLVRSGGDAAEEIRDYLATRQADQGNRVARFTDEAFGLNNRTANQITDSLKNERGQAADAAYDAARGNAGPVDVRRAVSVIDERIGPMQGSGIVGDGIDGKLARYRNRLAARAPEKSRLGGTDLAGEGIDSTPTSVELSDFNRVLGVKQSVQDDIGAAVRAGRNNEARELRKLEAALDEALQEASDQYRVANDGFREASRVIDAIDEGRGMARPSTRAADNVQRFGQMAPEQQATARVGYGDEAMKRIERNKSPTANKAKEVYGSTKSRVESDAMATDPRLFGDRMARENTMWDTQNIALGGSRTADNLADQQAAQQATSGIMQAGRSLANLQFGDAIANTGRALGPVLGGQNEATKKLLAEMLMSDDPAKALGKAAISDRKKMALQLIMEGMARGGTMRGFE